MSAVQYVGRPPSFRRAAVPVAAGFAILAFLTAGSSAQTSAQGTYGGGAFSFSANAKAGPLAANLERAARINCPCEGTDGELRTTRVQSVSDGDGGGTTRAGASEATAYTKSTPTTALVRNNTTTRLVRVFNGLISADSIKAEARVSATGTTMATSVSNSKFENLRIAGRPIASNVPPNTTIPLPGIGSVVLKKTEQGGDLRERASTGISMITVMITQSNRFGLAIGSEIIVARATATFERSEAPVIVGGNAYVSSTNTKVGRTTQTRLDKIGTVGVGGCQGTGGKTVSNTVASLDGGNILTATGGTARVFTDIEPAVTTVKSFAESQGANLLAGMLRATSIRASAQETLRSGVRRSSTTGSGLYGARLLGRSIGDITEPNTRLELPGVGYVIINEQIRPRPGSKDPLRVNGLHLFVTQTNGFGLPVGSEIINASARSNIYPSGFATP